MQLNCLLNGPQGISVYSLVSPLLHERESNYVVNIVRVVGWRDTLGTDNNLNHASEVIIKPSIDCMPRITLSCTRNQQSPAHKWSPWISRYVHIVPTPPPHVPIIPSVSVEYFRSNGWHYSDKYVHGIKSTTLHSPPTSQPVVGGAVAGNPSIRGSVVLRRQSIKWRSIRCHIICILVSAWNPFPFFSLTPTKVPPTTSTPPSCRCTGFNNKFYTCHPPVSDIERVQPRTNRYECRSMKGGKCPPCHTLQYYISPPHTGYCHPPVTTSLPCDMC